MSGKNTPSVILKARNKTVSRDHLRIVEDAGTHAQYLVMYIPNLGQEGIYTDYMGELNKSGLIGNLTYIKRQDNFDPSPGNREPFIYEINDSPKTLSDNFPGDKYSKCCYARALPGLEEHLKPQPDIGIVNKRTVEQLDIEEYAKKFINKQVKIALD